MDDAIKFMNLIPISILTVQTFAANRANIYDILKWDRKEKKQYRGLRDIMA